MIGDNDSGRFNFLVRILKNQCPTWYPKKKYKSEKSVPKLVQILKVRAQVGKNSELKTKFWKASAQVLLLMPYFWAWFPFC